MIPLAILDNGGETFDRYTFIFDSQDPRMKIAYWGASEAPSHPQGFGQFCGDGISEEEVLNMINDGRAGNVISALELPEGARKFYTYLATPENDNG